MKDLNDDLRSFVLGALLHDIGKFKQRTDLPEDAGKTHVEIGHNWLISQYGEGLIASGARNHHGNEPETWETNFGLIFYEADNCSASERCDFDPQTDIGKAWHRQMRLGNVFGHVRNPDPDARDPEQVPAGTYWPLHPLGGWLEPDQDEGGETSAEAYRRMWEYFEQEFQAVKRAENHVNVDVMLHLLEKYTTFIPSITLKIKANTERETYRKHTDVSLFDHLKIAAAVATCLYHYHSTMHRDRWERREPLKEEITDRTTWDDPQHQPFQLIGGDLSGVQKFIYTISSKGALKSLKGRSFFLELLTEHVVDRLLEDMQLTRCNVIFTGGGHFYVIGPNTKAAKQAVVGVRAEINDYLLEAFGGTLWLAIEVAEFGKLSFKDPSPVWQTLSGRLEEAKSTKWVDKLATLLNEPHAPHESCNTDNCAVCGREDRMMNPIKVGDDSVLMCEPCADQYRLGDNLQRKGEGEWPVIYRWDREPDRESIRDACVQIGSGAGARYYQPAAGIFGKGKAELAAEASAVYHLNDWNLDHFTHRASRPVLVGSYAYREADGHVPDLEELISHGFGMERLGVLRMDVDRLGKIFTTAVPQGERTFSRMASLSRNLSLFFKYHLNHVLDVREGHGYETLPRKNVANRGNGSLPPSRRLAIVYSGGDDLFLIGHWLDVTEAAFDIRAAFTQFTGNPFITLSAGIALGYPHEPVYRLAEAAGEAEEQAKRHKDREGRDRNAVTLFATRTVKWNEAEAVATLLQEGYRPLCEITGQQLTLSPWSLSRGFLYRVLSLTRDYVGLNPDKTKKGVLVLPKIAYLIGRGGLDGKFEKRNLQQEAWMKLKNCLATWPIPGAETNFRHLEIATMWVLMLMRRGDSPETGTFLSSARRDTTSKEVNR